MLISKGAVKRITNEVLKTVQSNSFSINLNAKARETFLCSEAAILSFIILMLLLFYRALFD